jgi:myosin-5
MVAKFWSMMQEVDIKTNLKEISEARDTLPPLRNPPLLETADDLATLSHLNEPSGAFFF